MKSVRKALVALSIAASCVMGASAAFAQEHGHHTVQLEQHGGHGESAHGEHGAEHGAAHGAEHGAAHGPDSMNWSTFGGTHTTPSGETKPNPPPFAASLINFAILAAILYFAVKRSVNPALATRRSAIESEISEAQRLKAEAEAMHREYAERLAGAEGEFDKMRQDVVKAGELEAQKIIDEARVKADRMQAEGQALIAQEVRALRADLTREVVESAMKAAHEAVRESIKSADQSRLADDFVAGLERAASVERGVA